MYGCEMVCVVPNRQWKISVSVTLLRFRNEEMPRHLQHGREDPLIANVSSPQLFVDHAFALPVPVSLEGGQRAAGRVVPDSAVAAGDGCRERHDEVEETSHHAPSRLTAAHRVTPWLPDPVKTIAKGKARGATVTFTTPTMMNGRETTITWRGELKDDRLTFTRRLAGGPEMSPVSLQRAKS